MTPLLGSPAELIRAVLAEVREEHGDVERFLLAIGMADDVPDRLRTALLEP